MEYQETKFYKTLMKLASNLLERKYLDEQSKAYISAKGNYEYAVRSLCKYLDENGFDMDTYIVYRVSDAQMRMFYHKVIAEKDTTDVKTAVLIAKMTDILNELLMKNINIMEMWPVRDVRCDCGTSCHLISAEHAYSPSAVVLQNLKGRYYYRCPRCGAMVGTHAGTNIPLGTPVNKLTAQMRQKTHEQIEQILQEGLEKTDVYQYLSQKMPGWEAEKVHVGNFDVQTCVEAKKILDTLQANPKQVKMA